MSDAVSAMMGASFDGIAKVEEAGLIGMITLRGDLASAAMVKAVKVATDAAIPGQREITHAGGFRVVWMSPDELLITCDHAQAEAVVGSLTKSLEGEHSLAVNVSDARAVFDVSGTQARDVLAKVMPVDFSAGGFGADSVRRSRLAQVAAAVWAEGEDRFRVVCFRSAGRYVFDVLSAAAAEGSEVGLLG
ncbi:sarcosine oxidase subunit gamma family protein [Alisedimentitalea sp. MJ-SS2]|uniref:sarcosine oxidase subunit gamma n=1 Tax=Aliisedimentitalea sp. MJ-SS2 TaxID=3049795 RepID=UPI0029104966|nr:sarcosine oxidase subunit gamma family protein [Alisedimentitalea sp. MJ-SS2]MDU8928937.1 sarcosine oxidase subunit gamma family protein [Alisedimentitalea sp. MJ-SS2]